MADSRLPRFNRTERLVHLVQAVTFLILLATGLMISVAALQEVVGHRALLREIHLATAFFFVFGPAIVALAGDRRSIREDIRAVDDWGADDIAWIVHPTTRPDASTPPPGRYNAGQKLNAVFTVYCTAAFGVTGLILWQNRRFPFQVVSAANSIHTYLAYLALAVFLGHLYLSVVHPATREAFWGIVTGTVDQAWAREHHPAWKPSLERAGLNTGAIARSTLLTLVLLEGALLISRFGLEWLGANVTDPVIKLIYRFSGLPGTLPHPATAVHGIDPGALLWLGLAVALAVGIARGQDLLPSMAPSPVKS